LLALGYEGSARATRRPLAIVKKHGQGDPEPDSGLGGGRLGAAWGVTPDVATGVERRGLEP